jgi:hypothetical protein
MDLAKRDLYLSQIKEQIKRQDQYLLKKRKELEQKYKLNEYLEDIKNDYVSYSEEIRQERQKQLEALKAIKHHLDNLIKMEQVAGDQLRTAKHELAEVLKEIKKLENE